MTRTGYRLAQLGEELTWGTLGIFIKGLGPDSATYASMHPERYAWDSGAMVPWILADLIDAVNFLRYEHALANTPKNASKPKEPRPYPRPGAENETEYYRVGRDPIPISKFNQWWEGEETG